MLKFALDYAEELKRADRASWRDPKYKWYHLGGFNENIVVDENTWSRYQMVSVDKDNNVIGYLSADVDRSSDYLFRLRAINYTDKCNLVFAKDMYDFFRFVFVERGSRRMEWSVVVGNPIEKMYDKFCRKVNGNIVGICHKSVKLMDGQYADLKTYEVFGDDVRAYLKKKEEQ
jgi:hypothetical protein